MKIVPKLEHDFILNELEYETCKSWLDEANAEIIRHPLDDPELGIERRRVKALLAEYEQNWRRSNAASGNNLSRP